MAAPQQPLPGGAVAAPSSFAVPAGLAAILSGVKERAVAIGGQQKPWTEVFDRSALSKPESLGEVTREREGVCRGGVTACRTEETEAHSL